MNTVETGLQAGPPEKKTAKLADGIEGDTFSGPVCERESAELRRFLVIFGIIRADFSALQTVWRRGRDSNSRYSFDALSLDVSLLANNSRELAPKSIVRALQSVRFRFDVRSTPKGECQAIVWLKVLGRRGVARAS
jgi:hypothetical protein